MQNFGSIPTGENWRSQSQQVKIGRTLSSKSALSSGVPQGGILSPIIFIIYGADMELWLITKFSYSMILKYFVFI